jgi:hypothetical protein
MSASGRVLTVVTLYDFSTSATCYAEPTAGFGQERSCPILGTERPQVEHAVAKKTY